MSSYTLRGFTIEFSVNFNESLDDYYDIIDGMKYLGFEEHYEDSGDHTFGQDSAFNCRINRLPPSLTHVHFGNCFNSKVNLPNALTHLYFGDSFNEIIEYPNTLTHLRFGEKFNQPITLPENLTHLIFSQSNNYRHNLVLHDKITHLKVSCSIRKLPKKLLYFSGYIMPNMQFPNTLIFLCVRYSKNYMYDNLPNNLESLVIRSDFNATLNNLPNSLKRLFIDLDNEHPFDENTKKDVKKKISSIVNSLPNHITHFACPTYFEQLVVPSQLTHLTLGHRYFPQYANLARSVNLTHLILESWNTNYTRMINSIPDNVQQIILVNSWGLYEFEERINDCKPHLADKIISWSSDDKHWLLKVGFDETSWAHMRFYDSVDLY